MLNQSNKCNFLPFLLVYHRNHRGQLQVDQQSDSAIKLKEKGRLFPGQHLLELGNVLHAELHSLLVGCSPALNQALGFWASVMVS